MSRSLKENCQLPTKQNVKKSPKSSFNNKKTQNKGEQDNLMTQTNLTQSDRVIFAYSILQAFKHIFKLVFEVKLWVFGIVKDKDRIIHKLWVDHL